MDAPEPIIIGDEFRFTPRAEQKYHYAKDAVYQARQIKEPHPSGLVPILFHDLNDEKHRHYSSQFHDYEFVAEGLAIYEKQGELIWIKRNGKAVEAKTRPKAIAA